MVALKICTRRIQAILALTIIVAMLSSLVPNQVQAVQSGQNGKILYARTIASEVILYSAREDGSDAQQISAGPLDISQGKWSQANKQFLFQSNRDGNNEIFKMNADGSNQVQLTNTSGINGQGTWSPDSSKVGFYSDNSGNNDIYTMNPDGTGLTNITAVYSSTSEVFTDWATPGILYQGSTSGNGTEVHLIQPDGSGLTELTTTGGFNRGARWSPDGNKIVFESTRDGGVTELYTMDADGSNQTRITNTPSVTENRPIWSPDGNKIAYYATNGSSTDIYTMNSDGSNLVLAIASSDNETTWDWLPLQTPDTPGGASTPNPSDNGKPAWTWPASPVLFSTIDHYNLEWSQDSTFTTGVQTGTTSTNSYTHTAMLGNGTWYFRTQAVSVDNMTSSFSPASTVLVNAIAGNSEATDPGSLANTGQEVDKIQIVAGMLIVSAAAVWIFTRKRFNRYKSFNF